MPVIINEFEVVVDQPPQQQGVQTQAQAGAAAPASLNPQAVFDLLRHQAGRMLRLKAE